MKLKIPLPRNLFWPHCEEIPFSKPQLMRCIFTSKKLLQRNINFSTRLRAFDFNGVSLFLCIFALHFSRSRLNSDVRISEKFFPLLLHCGKIFSLWPLAFHSTKSWRTTFLSQTRYFVHFGDGGCRATRENSGSREDERGREGEIRRVVMQRRRYADTKAHNAHG